MAKTIANQLAEALILRGWTEGQKQSGYRKFEKAGETESFRHPLGGSVECPKRYWIGPNGALRTGASPSSSRSLTDTKFYKELLGTANLPFVDLKL